MSEYFQKTKSLEVNVKVELDLCLIMLQKQT